MFTKAKNWWNKEKIALEQELVATKAKLEQVEAEQVVTTNLLIGTNDELAAVQADFAEAQAELDEIKAKDPHKSITPWFNLTTDVLDPVKGLQVDMDWNEAFIQHLREAGHTGRDEEILVQKWLAMLYEDIITQLELKIIDMRDGRKESDFQ